MAWSWALSLSDALLIPSNVGENHFLNSVIFTVLGGLRVTQEERGTGDQQDRSCRTWEGLVSIGVKTDTMRSSHTFQGPVEDFPRSKGPAATADHHQGALWSLLQPRAVSQTYTQSLFSWNSHVYGTHPHKNVSHLLCGERVPRKSPCLEGALLCIARQRKAGDGVGPEQPGFVLSSQEEEQVRQQNSLKQQGNERGLGIVSRGEALLTEAQKAPRAPSQYAGTKKPEV